MTRCCARSSATFQLLVLLVTCAGSVAAAELTPSAVERPLGAQAQSVGRFSDRTVVAAVTVDRDSARLEGHTLKRRPFVRSLEKADEPRAWDRTRAVQLEIALLGPGGMRYTQRQDVDGLCLAHPAGAEPHVSGDTIRVHRESYLVELPDLAGYDSFEIAYYEDDQAETLRHPLAVERLDQARFLPAGGPFTFSDAAFATPNETTASPPPTPAASSALWPEDFDDPEIYHVWGDETEADRRINVVIVPDGYTYAEKAVMESHAEQMVDYFRTTIPFTQHDPFMNYTLVHAYSVDSGTDQCDCGVVLNTAMGTRFPDAVPNCGDSANRCLFYQPAVCDSSGLSNIVAAELRAPAHDVTVVMVNTTRYGGCGGSRAVYSAAVGSATDIAVHELGHTLGGLADEYGGNPSCGGSAGEVNTSLDPVDGAWPEWIDDIGAPKEGAQYYELCIFRPSPNCEMRSLFQPFCPVCKQHWSLVTFGHPRVHPTAPISSMSPGPAASAYVGVPAEFSVTTRLSTGAQNSIVWSLLEPGSPDPTIVGFGSTSHTQTFSQVGTYSLSCRVAADTNFVKPSKAGANVDAASWAVQVTELETPGEVSPPGAVEPLLFPDRQTVSWEDASSTGAFTYNVYRGELEDLGGTGYGECLEQGLVAPQTTDETTPAIASGWFYLVTGVNPVGEGPLGVGSSGSPRPNGAPCAE